MCILKSKIQNVIVCILGIVLAITPYVIAPICPVMDGVKMGCYYSGLLALHLGVTIAIISIILMFVKNKVVDIVLNILNACIALSVHLIIHRVIYWILYEI